MAIPHAEPRRIIKNPRVLHAEPILDGTRIPVRTVALLISGRVSMGVFPASPYRYLQQRHVPVTTAKQERERCPQLIE